LKGDLKGAERHYLRALALDQSASVAREGLAGLRE
jgi:hypothetical protein